MIGTQNATNALPKLLVQVPCNPRRQKRIAVALQCVQRLTLPAALLLADVRDLEVVAALVTLEAIHHGHQGKERVVEGLPRQLLERVLDGADNLRHGPHLLGLLQGLHRRKQPQVEDVEVRALSRLALKLYVPAVRIARRTQIRIVRQAVQTQVVLLHKHRPST